MKKLLCVLTLIPIFFTGCSSADNKVLIACEEGYECPQAVSDAINEFYAGQQTEIVNVDRSKIGDKAYNVSIGNIKMGASLGYGVWPSKVMAYENACTVAYEDYRMVSDFSGKKAGVFGDIKSNQYIDTNDDCEYMSYTSAETILSDLKAGVIDVIICLPDAADAFFDKDDSLRVNDLMDSEIYEYVVVSSDIELINSLDKVIE
jgi:hypothetical protein